MPGLPDGELHARRILDHYRLSAADEWTRAVGRQVFAGVVGVQLLDEEIGDIAPGIGETPGDALVVPDQHDGRSRHGPALELMRGRRDVDKIPDAGDLQAKVRIVGEDRLAG